MVKFNRSRRRSAVGHPTTRHSTLCAAAVATAVEALESRKLLSSGTFCVGSWQAQPQLHVLPALAPAAGDPSAVDGFSPSQVRHAYGFDGISGNGAGQTIALIDAFNNPNIESDLRVFDQKFGLADPPSFRKVSQSGGSTANVKTDTGWASEIALDVEWAHAIAPGANILLVEAKSDNISDLMAGVAYARSAPGVSVVSMSWGGSEYGGQTAYDHDFSTPGGHGGVTFVAASGDEGMRYGPEWPATSPYVLSVGGTSLKTADAGGSYGSETSWRDSTGGVSAYYSTPSYQVTANTAGQRSAPDVAYDADPNTGFAVYSSVKDAGYVGWQVIGGTSAGAPQWAALIALANQKRVAAGMRTLDGAADTLPALYGLYSAPGSATYASYTADFHDIASGGGGGGGRHFRPALAGAHSGYDTVTGLGSPLAFQVVAVLGNVPGSTPVAIPAPNGAKLGKSSKKRHPGDDVEGETDIAQTSILASAAILAGANSDAMPDAAGTGLVNLPGQGADVAPQSASPAVAAVGAVVAEASSTGLYTISLGAQISTVERVAGEVMGPAYRAGSQAVAEVAAGVVDGVLGRVAAKAPGGVVELGTGIDPRAAFSDAMASFAHESAALGAIVAEAAAAAGGSASTHGRAWAVTAGVLVADAFMIGAWHTNARAKRRAKRAAGAAMFSIVPVER